MAKRSKRSVKSKAEVLISKKGDIIYVGIDVHKKKYHIAVWKNGFLASYWVMPPNDQKVAEMLKAAGDALQNVVYEAGPTGFGLARVLNAAGLPVGVVDPGSTPRAVIDDNKSDRLDCRKLAEYCANNMLKYVGIPTETEDQERQMIRMRDDQMKKRKRIMQQIKSFLLYNSISEPEGLKSWTIKSVNALREIELPPLLRYRLDEFLEELKYYNNALKRTEKQLKQYAETHKKKIKILRTHPGVGPKTSRQFLAEIFNPKRFANGKQVAKYLGLAPKVKSTEDTRRGGGVLKGGRGPLRSMLIEACWQWIRYDQAANQRYLKYLSNTGSGKKAIYAMARKMATNLWNMLVKEEEYKTAAA